MLSKNRNKILIIIIFLSLLLSGCTTPVDTNSYNNVNKVSQPVQVEERIQYDQPTSDIINNVTPEQKVIPATNDVELSNDNYYTNTQGNKVHSPAYADSVPAGASAKCRDGTYSFSQSRRGTCSHHGGVAQWL